MNFKSDVIKVVLEQFEKEQVELSVKNISIESETFCEM